MVWCFGVNVIRRLIQICHTVYIFPLDLDLAARVQDRMLPYRLKFQVDETNEKAVLQKNVRIGKPTRETRGNRCALPITNGDKIIRCMEVGSWELGTTLVQALLAVLAEAKTSMHARHNMPTYLTNPICYFSPILLFFKILIISIMQGRRNVDIPATAQCRQENIKHTLVGSIELYMNPCLA